MQPYHIAWLSVHPERTEQWLRDRLKDGFHVHHIDGDHSNDDPRNLVLIESGDHMMLHNGSTRLLWKPLGDSKNKGGRPRKNRSITPTSTPIEVATVALPKAKIAKQKSIQKIMAGVYRAAIERQRQIANGQLIGGE